MTERFQGGRLVARALAAEGVDAIFTLSGGHVMPIYEGCRLEGLRVVDVRHEQTAAHAAEAYGRMRRAAGVAVVTAGPGVTGTVTAIANAFAGQAPLVVIGGARPLVQSERGALQELDQLGLMKSITKWAGVCAHTERIPEHVALAFRHALASPRGPVYLELPMDVLFEEAAPDPPVGRSRVEARPRPDERDVERAAALLASAERPAILAGSGVWWEDGAAALDRLATALDAPVFLNGAGRGSLSPDHPLLFHHARSAALSGADLVLVVGAPLDFRLRFGAFGAGALVHAHSDPRELGRNRVPDAALLGDTGLTLAALAAVVPERAGAHAPWLEEVAAAERAWHAAHAEELASPSAPLHHYRLASELAAALPEDAVVIGDGGDVVAAVSRVLRAGRPGHWLDPGPFGCLGVGPGYALGVGVAGAPGPIVVVLGDGAFGLNAMDVDSLVRAGVPAVLVVGNDGAWGEIRVPQVGIYGQEGEIATRLLPSRYDRLVEVVGGHGEHVERPEELRPALERALASGTTAIVNVLLDPDAMAGHAYRGL